MAHKLKIVPERVLERVFNDHDFDHDGQLSCDELQNMLKALNVPDPDAMAQEMVRDCDPKAKRRISLGEIVRWSKEH